MMIKKTPAAYGYCQASILRCERGVAFIEFALCIPFLLVLFFGAVEVSRYFLAIQKVEKTLDLVTNTIGQADQTSTTQNLTTSGLNSLFSVVPSMMNPYEVGARGKVFITSVTMTGGNVLINWQACGGGTLTVASALGVASGNKSSPNTATLPARFTMREGEEVLIGEIYYNFSPILLQNIIGDLRISRNVFYIPRIGSLAGFNSKCT